MIDDNLVIREATLNDLDTFLKLDQELFKYETRYSDTFNTDWPMTNQARQQFAARIVDDRALILLADLDGTAIGFLFALLLTQNYRSKLINPIAELASMFVLEEFRKQGVGTKLVLEYKKWAQRVGAKRYKVLVMKKNIPAHNLYKKMGFEDMSNWMEQPVSGIIV